ncbi:MAG: sulfite exporter TauE/SafE family protein [Ilumatobacteraceae bacterium]
MNAVAIVLDPALALGGLFGGFAVGLTGMGGGALLTPMLVLFFNVPAGAAVGTDLVASLVMKPVSGAVHLRQRTVRLDIVRWLCLGSIPGALGGALLVSRLSQSVRDVVLLRGIAVALLVAAATMTLRMVREHRSLVHRPVADHGVRRAATVALGLAGGVVVGLTSVGSGSLMIVVLTMLYPALSASELVGTDLVQAIPLVATAALGHLLLGDVRLGLTTSLLVGAMPGAYLGARLSSSRTSRIVRPALIVLLVASGARLLTA